MGPPAYSTATSVDGSPVLLRAGTGRALRMQLAATIVEVGSSDTPVAGSDGLPLPDGCAVELGCFSEASISAPLAGQWMPLIGPGSLPLNRRVGLLRTGANGAERGSISWCRTFYPGIDALPPAGAPLALRIYDHAEPAKARSYNTVSHASWWFRSPRAPDPSLVSMILDETCVWQSGKTGAFETVLSTPITSLTTALRRVWEHIARPQPVFRAHPAPVTSPL